MKTVREPAVAGMFYPGSVSKLKDQLKLLFEISQPEKKYENIFGLISPHAGYAYSGKTAAYAFNTISDKNYSTVIIISPSHREYFAGSSIYKGDAYKTPLGEVPVNKEMREKLTDESKTIFSGGEGHRAEHAIEVQIPFLQMLFDNFSIVPIVMGDQSKMFVDDLAERLTKVVDDKTLIISSSDLSHFYNKELANELDTVVETHVKNFDYNGLQENLSSGKCEACGGGPIIAMMKTADMKQKRNSDVLHRSDSGDITGDNTEVVGYLSAAIFGN
jgi:AmmeMemoRadiSam system protein B